MRSRTHDGISCRRSRARQLRRAFPQRRSLLRMPRRWRAKARARANDHRRMNSCARAVRTKECPRSRPAARSVDEDASERTIRIPPIAEHRSAAVATWKTLTDARFSFAFGTERVGGDEL